MSPVLLLFVQKPGRFQLAGGARLSHTLGVFWDGWMSQMDWIYVLLFASAAILISAAFIYIKRLRRKISSVRDEVRSKEAELAGLNTALQREQLDRGIAEQRRSESKKYFQDNDVSATENQIRFITDGRITKSSILNQEERRLYWPLISIAKDHNLYLFAQVNLGTYLRTDDSEVGNKTYGSINSKRTDFLMADRSFIPVLAIEYNGAGHFGKTADNRRNAEHRDEVKRIALAKAGIGLFVSTEEMITVSERHEEMKLAISKLLDELGHGKSVKATPAYH
jgi:hypothetical protein